MNDKTFSVTTLNKNISIVEKARKKHSKASEEYIHVKFTYQNVVWDGWVPVEYRRTGISLKNDDEVNAHLNIAYEQMNPDNFSAWVKKQEEFWADKQRAQTTKAFFDSLIKGGWQCVDCTLPKNPNWARRIQDLKEFGYTLATNTKHYCPNCKANKTHLILLPIERGGVEGNGYETWTPGLRKKIIKILGSVDVYENNTNPHCLPDHKFPEIRWDENTKEENPEHMNENEIRQKFQLLTNQRNQQKREVCRNCYQTGKRGYPFGIKYFYSGSYDWDKTIPQKGKSAEKGCVGCGWYDMSKWRDSVLEKLTK
ncbi:restriction endonuclease [Dehalobacter sp.]|uniref:restriction endonuclease n=1 Tax=Dehalobacter sp. TaxID=1962289 RepID=UPI00258D51E1|nr:restriction endonuclease [Dehalobacter sp.]MCG1024512.1 restriction endonuclease [Dehalobacter sp.]